MAGAVKLAERLGDAGGVIVFVVPDDGWKYLSTGAYTDPIDDVVARADRCRSGSCRSGRRPGP